MDNNARQLSNAIGHYVNMSTEYGVQWEETMKVAQSIQTIDQANYYIKNLNKRENNYGTRSIRIQQRASGNRPPMA